METLKLIFGVERWFKYQSNEQNLQIQDMQISQIAKFKLRLILWEQVTNVMQMTIGESNTCILDRD